MSTLAEIAEAAAIAGVVPGGALALGAVKVWAEETGQKVDPATGEVVTDKTADQPEPGHTPRTAQGAGLPEAVLDTFRQFYQAGSKHQWDIGRVVDDALIEFAGKISANRILRAAAKEMDLSRSQVLKCQFTWAATDEQLRGEFDQLRFEHFAAVVRYVKDRADVHKWLLLAVESSDDYNGRFMPAAKLESKIKKALGIGPVEPTKGELIERAVQAVERLRNISENEAEHAALERVIVTLEKMVNKA